MTQATFGQMLAAADARFARQGGYRATAFCEERRVDLVFRAPCGHEATIASAPMPEGLAPEDIAHDLLVARIGAAAADASYFVITIA